VLTVSHFLLRDLATEIYLEVLWIYIDDALDRQDKSRFEQLCGELLAIINQSG